MIAFYLQNSSNDLNRLCNLSSIEQCFYIASMLLFTKQNNEDKIALAKLSNPFIKSK